MRKLLYLLIIYVFFQGCNGKEKARENEKKKDLAISKINYEINDNLKSKDTSIDS